MKIYFVLLFFIANTFSFFSQKEDVLTNLTQPLEVISKGKYLYVTDYNKILKIDVATNSSSVLVEGKLHSFIATGLALKDNDLYISDRIAGKIFKVDVTSSTPIIPTEVVSGLNFPYGMAFKDDDLYFTQFAGSKVSRININSSVPNVVDIVTGITNPRALVFIDNDLFITQSGGFDTKIWRVSLEDTNNPQLVSFLRATSPQSIIAKGKELYFISITSLIGAGINRISKVDVTSNYGYTDIFEVQGGIGGLAFVGNDVFISEVTNKKVTKVDVNEIEQPTIPEDFVDNLNTPVPLAFINDELYFSENSIDHISKINTSLDNPSAIKVVDVDNPLGLASKGNDLYFSEFVTNKILKVNVTQNQSQPLEIVNEISAPAGLAFKDNELYIAVNGENKIVKINTTDSTPIPIDVVTNLKGPVDLVFIKDELFFNQAFDAKISKINVKDERPKVIDVVTNVQVDGLAAHDNDLYFGLYPNNVAKVDVTQSTPVIEEVLTGLKRIEDIIIKNDVIYISEANGNRISKFNLQTLSNQKSELLKGVSLHPNPFKNTINLNINNQIILEKIETYNLLGKLIFQTKNRTLNLDGFPNGVYIVKVFTNRGVVTKKVVKQ